MVNGKQVFLKAGLLDTGWAECFNTLRQHVVS